MKTASAIRVPPASKARAVIRTESPTAMRSLGDVTSILTGSGSTTTRVEPVALFALAEMVALPLPTAVTSPSRLMVATARSLVDQATGTSGIVWPVASNTTAEKRSVSPIVTNFRGLSEGWRRTDAGACLTSAVIESARVPWVAPRVAIPLSTDVISPSWSTVTTDVLLEDHATLASAIGRPLGSRTKAVTRTVSASASMSRRRGGGILNEWGRCRTATRAESFASPAAATMYADPLSTAVTRPP